MKKTIVALLIIVSVVLLSPKIIGSIVKTETQTVIDRMNEHQMMSVERTEFNQRWFDADSVTKISYVIDGYSNINLDIFIKEQYSFGPIIFTEQGMEFALSYATTTFEIDSLEVDQEIMDAINKNVKVTSLMNYSKDLISRIDVNKVDHEVDNSKIVFHQAEGEFTLSNYTHIKGDFNWGGVEISSQGEVLKVGPTAMNIDSEVIRGNLFAGNAISIGDFSVTLENLHISTLEQGDVNLDDIKMSVVSDVKDDLVTIGFGYDIGKVAAQGMEFSDANLDLLFSNLDVNVIEKLNATYAKISVSNDPQDLQQQTEKLGQIASSLLEKNPTFEFTDFSLKGPNGKFQSKAKMTIDKDKYDATNVMTLMMAINADADGSVSIAVLENLGMLPMADMYVQQGLLIKEGEEIKFNLGFNNGQLVVNGQVMPM